MKKILCGMMLVLAVSACSKKDEAASEAATAVAGQPGYVNKVWKVSASNGVAPGQLYVFLSEGTLIMASSSGRPVVGAWEGGEKELNMIEGGVPHRTEILSLKSDELKLKTHHPNGAIDITLVPAG
ncbi:MAG: hypothetical protein Q8J78_07855 [Moraxellaceae bacterium]|nr:hypothetical protein [Moraxellaceae bacterium]